MALREDLSTGQQLSNFTHRGLKLEVTLGRTGAWLAIRRSTGTGVALRVAPTWGLHIEVETLHADSTGLCLNLNSTAGQFQIRISTPDLLRDLVRAEVSLRPHQDLILGDWPRDLYPVGSDDEPLDTSGRIWAAQRGYCSGLLYVTLENPPAGNILYFQNFTRLNDYFSATGTKPDSAVGGDWPELGLQLPRSADRCLRSGREYIISDAFFALDDDGGQPATKPSPCSQTFLELLGGIYACLNRIPTDYHDWPWRSQRTLHDLQCSPLLTTEYKNKLYFRPYIDAEYPDSMVQLAVLTPIREYEAWRKHSIPLAEQAEAGLEEFFDSKLQTIRRYLPNVGDEKDSDEVDSWYLYHPLSNLARLALAGDEAAKRIFFASIDFAIHVAQHFNYRWPVQYKLSTLDVIKQNRKPGEPGQSDVGGIYAYVMMQAFELTQEDRFLQEARKAIRALSKYRFELLYQSNLSSWGAAACGRLWTTTGDLRYLEQSYVFLANLFHNSAIWQSELGQAKHYSTFFGVTCLHDGPYLAIYECYETFSALTEYLIRTYDALPNPIRMLVAEHIRHGANRAWSFFPDQLPFDALASNIRNGHLDRRLSIPVEDLYVNGEPAGSVGQEVYGCGAAFAFTTHSYHRLDRGFLLYCEYPIRGLTTFGDRVAFEVLGGAGMTCRARLIPDNRRTRSSNWRIGPATAKLTREGHYEFSVTPGPIELCLEALPH